MVKRGLFVNRMLSKLLPIVMGFGLASPVWCETVNFTDRQTWASASADFTTIDFIGLGGAGPGQDQGYLAGLSVDGVSFTGVWSG
jgi:hypothetical protein